MVMMNKLRKYGDSVTEYFQAKKDHNSAEVALRHTKSIIDKFEVDGLYEELMRTQLYGDFGNNIYAVGTFGGFDEMGRIVLIIDDGDPERYGSHMAFFEPDNVYDYKTMEMTLLQCGIEYEQD